MQMDLANKNISQNQDALEKAEKYAEEVKDMAEKTQTDLRTIQFTLQSNIENHEEELGKKLDVLRKDFDENEVENNGKFQKLQLMLQQSSKKASDTNKKNLTEEINKVNT